MPSSQSSSELERKVYVCDIHGETLNVVGMGAGRPPWCVECRKPVDVVRLVPFEQTHRPRCQHCVPAAPADERSFMCEDCMGIADEDAQHGRDAEAAHGDLVQAFLDVLEVLGIENDSYEAYENLPAGPLVGDRHAIGEHILKALDADRERTGTDEWDETDQRCALYNIAHFLSGRA